MSKTLLLFLCCLSLATSQSPRSKRILNGRKMGQWELEHFYPYVINMLNCGGIKKRCSWCAGTLVSPQIVLLSAHCLCRAPGDGGKLTVYLNSTKLSKGRRVGAHVRKRKPYKCGQGHLIQIDTDIMTLTLNTPVYDITPMQLGCSIGPVAPKSVVTMLGYGVDNERKMGKLQVGYRRTMKCRKEYKGAICVDGNDPKKTKIFFADSGGPLIMYHNYSHWQIGIASSTQSFILGNGKNPKKDMTLTWTWVAPHCDWIFN